MFSLNALRFPGVVIIGLMAVASYLPAEDQLHYSRAELRKMLREAKTPEQQQTLARWFRQQQAAFRRKASEEDSVYERNKRSNVPAKFPAPADSARNLRDYYVYRANQSGLLAAKYEALSAQSAPDKAPATAEPHPAVSQ